MRPRVQVFSEEWFERHQDKLLFFLNEWPFRKKFRRLLCIHDRDCPAETEITHLGPNRFSYGNNVVQGRGGRIWTRTTDFRTHAKFSKRLFFGLHPLWWGMHAWDAILAEKLIPALDLGFDTLTQYPSYPVTNTCDGITGTIDSDFTWNNRTALANAAITSFGIQFPPDGPPTAPDGIGWELFTDVYSGPSPLYFTCFFGPLYLFDTSSLGASASILSATETITSPSIGPPYNWNFSSGLPAFTIVASNPASNTSVHNGDIATFGSVPFCDTPVPMSSFAGGKSPINWLFNSNGRLAISKTGITKTALRDTVYDIPNISPTGNPGESGFMYLTFSSFTGQTYDPKLVVIWSAGGAVSGGYENEISVRSRVVSPRNDAIDVLPAIQFPPPGIWGMEQSLPPLHQVPFTRCEPVNVYPSVTPLPTLPAWGQDPILPPPFKTPQIKPDPVSIGVPASLPKLKPAAFEPVLPPQWRKPPPQAGLVDVLPLAPRRPWGWEPLLAPQYRLPYPRAGLVETYPRPPIQPWGFEQALPVPRKTSLPPPSYVDVLPCALLPRSGWEAAGALPSRLPNARSSSVDVLPAFLRGAAGWEATGPPQLAPPGLRAGDPGVLPALFLGAWGWEAAPPPLPRRTATLPHQPEALAALLAGTWGWEAVGALAYRPVAPQPTFADTLPGMLAAAWGWESAPPPLPRLAASLLSQPEVLAPLLAGTWGWEAAGSLAYRPVAPQPTFADTLPGMLALSWGWDPPGQHLVNLAARQVSSGDAPVFVPVSAWGWESQVSARAPVVVVPSAVDAPPPPSLSGAWGWEGEPRAPGKSASRILLFDDWWPGVVAPFRPTGGGYKPWYGWRYPETYEDDDLRQRLERDIEAIDEELAALAADEEEPDQDSRIVRLDVLPPGWQESGWRQEFREKREDARRRREDPYRHVHYNFASDLDFGVRRRIIGILDRAEHRRANIFGSEAFRTCEGALVRGRFVEQGTNAWVLRLDKQARLEIAREAVAEGFKLVSFDDTSLSFIHRSTFPWKPVLWGAAAGSAIMGAGVFTGYLIWGRRPRS